MIFETRRHRRRRQRYAAGFLPEWRDLLGRRVGHWALLSDDERARVEGLALTMIADIRWEAAHGFELTDEMRVIIAAQAAILLLGLPDDSFREVSSILVHPTTMVMEGPHSQLEGLMSDEPVELLGEAFYRGPVLIAWDTAKAEARHPGRGENVVFHEFAHALDMLDGTVNGTPPLPDQTALDRWVRVCTDVYEKVVVGAAGHSLRSYAGVNPAEFFAVATEVFFDAPHTLGEEHPDLYRVLADYYGQDPATRVPPTHRH